jgi:hypothetical protein
MPVFWCRYLNGKALRYCADCCESLSAQHLDDGDPNWDRRESSADISAVLSSVGDPFPVALMTSAAELCGDGQFDLLFGKKFAIPPDDDDDPAPHSQVV